MEEFKPINTQEEFNEAIRGRIERERSKFADYEEIKAKKSEYETQLSSVQQQLQQLTEEKQGFETQIAELSSKVKGYETDSVKTRIALEVGLPYELARRLTGETEEDIKADAKAMYDMINITKPTAPIKSPEPNTSTLDSAFQSLLNE